MATLNDPELQGQAQLNQVVTPNVNKRQAISEILVKWHMPTRQAAINEILALFQAHQQQLLTELLGHENAITILGTDGKPELIRFVPFSVINRKIGELNG